MPYGKGTYGSKVGRPSKKAKGKEEASTSGNGEVVRPSKKAKGEDNAPTSDNSEAVISPKKAGAGGKIPLSADTHSRIQQFLGNLLQRVPVSNRLSTFDHKEYRQLVSGFMHLLPCGRAGYSRDVGACV